MGGQSKSNHSSNRLFKISVGAATPPKNCAAICASERLLGRLRA
jgi:hypothetical protein